jgi:dephospho-CoA kinase
VHLFGLTGGIASGKTTVAEHLRSRSVPVIDADELAREVVKPGSKGLAALVEAFGPSVIDEHGALRRKTLARIVFSDDAARSRLNAITHPLIAALAAERVAELAAEGHALACYEAALILENGGADRYRPLIVVSCPEELQIARVRARDGASEAEATARVRAQMPLAQKVALADFVIDTTGPVDDTRRRTDEVLAAIAAGFQRSLSP